MNRRLVRELRPLLRVQASTSRLAAGEGAVKLSLDIGGEQPRARLPLEVQSISAAGLTMLTAGCGTTPVDKQAIGDPQTGDVLTFVLERDGQSTVLQANLVWLELSDGTADEQRLDLIVDTSDRPGWWEVQSALARE